MAKQKCTIRKSPIYMAIDQYGCTEHGLECPRRDLMNRYGAKTAKKMWVDKKGGGSAHIGYVVGGRWFTVYEVKPWVGMEVKTRCQNV